jgi:hypothetical protein
MSFFNKYTLPPILALLIEQEESQKQAPFVSQGLPFNYKKYPTVKFRQKFRLDKLQIVQLCDLLAIPDTWDIGNGTVIDGKIIQA